MEKTCIFCNRFSETLQENLKHMSEFHGFFIPDIDLAKDIEGFLTHLQKKVREFMLCIYCKNSYHNFKSVQAVQQHMIDKQHCFVNIENKSEFEGFYSVKLDNSYDVIDSDDEIDLKNYADLGSVSSETNSFTLLGSSMSKIPAEILPTGELKLENGKIIGNRPIISI